MESKIQKLSSWTFNSQGGLFPHTHTLTIPRSALADIPADGVEIATNEAYSLIFKHKHSVQLTAKDLQNLRGGQQIIVRDADKGRHSFTVKIDF